MWLYIINQSMEQVSKIPNLLESRKGIFEYGIVEYTIIEEGSLQHYTTLSSDM